jgi:hypothetical protein
MEFTIVLYCCLVGVLAENAKKYEMQPKSLHMIREYTAVYWLSMIIHSFSFRGLSDLVSSLWAG